MDIKEYGIWRVINGAFDVAYIGVSKPFDKDLIAGSNRIYHVGSTNDPARDGIEYIIDIVTGRLITLALH